MEQESIAASFKRMVGMLNAADDELEATKEVVEELSTIIAEQTRRIRSLEAAVTHAVEIAENKIIGGTWDDLLPYRKILDRK